MKLVNMDVTTKATAHSLLRRCAAVTLLLGTIGQATAQTAEVVLQCVWSDGGKLNPVKITSDALHWWNAKEWRWDEEICFRDRWEGEENALNIRIKDECKVTISSGSYVSSNSVTTRARRYSERVGDYLYYHEKARRFQFDRTDGTMEYTTTTRDRWMASPKDDKDETVSKNAACKHVSDPALDPRPAPLF